MCLSNLFYNPLDGWFKPDNYVSHHLSPNYDKRPVESAIDLLVLHSISLPPGEYHSDDVIDFFQNRLNFHRHPFYQQLIDLRVSTHLFIRRNGNLIQFVSCLDRAWHSGQSSFQGKENCNDFSIGIELEGIDNSIPDIPYQTFTTQQYTQLVNCVKLLSKHFPAITLERIVAHSTIAPERKHDPGPGFDWQYFYKVLQNFDHNP